MPTPRLTGARYVIPLREGGSMPAVVDTREAGPFVVKFLGAGQGAKALVAESLGAHLALSLGLPVPRPAFITLGEGFGKGEPDPEIQDILRGSIGLNFGLAWLPGALPFDPAADRDISPELAANIVWFDAFITNVDRAPRNVNLLVCREQVWMIDHGASLYIHHQWKGWEARAQSAFSHIQDHVLLPFSGDLEQADARLRPLLTDDALRAAVDNIPAEWLETDTGFASLDEHRQRYVDYLSQRLHGPRAWLREAVAARERGPVPYAPRATHRVV
ncbi:MAG TPA: HipA family kinase [Thermomicrobiales bacterium]|nr:HipA family kinase [Thermomicrobiales bacterium]